MDGRGLWNIVYSRVFQFFFFFLYLFFLLSVILFAMKQFAKVLNRSFVRIEEFEFQLWNNFFHLAVAFVTQDALQLENFSLGKRTKILER